MQFAEGEVDMELLLETMKSQYRDSYIQIKIEKTINTQDQRVENSGEEDNEIPELASSPTAK